jgi:ligand-binding sensor domain-containing protein
MIECPSFAYWRALALGLGLWSGAFSSQAASNSVPQYASRVWQMEDGLPHTIVQAITQTRNGFLWVGSREGMARFDGVSFLSFTAREFGTGLVQPSVTHLCETRDGSLWIGTENLGLFRLFQGRISRLRRAEGLRSDLVAGLQEMPDGSLWIAAGGLACLSDGKLAYPFQPQVTGSVALLFLDPEGVLWMAGRGVKTWPTGK